jgi:hypothetical protein
MKFGDFWTDSPSSAAPAGELPILPDGTHVGTIGHASFREVEWKKSAANPQGQCLNLRIDVAGYQAAWDDIPVQMRNIIEAVCRSARVHPPSPTEDWDCEQLKGQTVTVETVNGVSKAGKPFVRVAKYRPSTPPLPKESAAKPQPRKAKQAVPDLAPDDIPF